jgi:hypothetical protein
MRFLLSFMMLSLLVVGGIADTNAAPPPDAAVTIRITPQIEMNADSIGFIIHPDGVGIISQGEANVVLYEIRESGEVIAIIGSLDNVDELYDVPKGIVVSGQGDKVIITSDIVVIKRKTFASHAQADESLEPGEEYYLAGDRGVYRKP